MSHKKQRNKREKVYTKAENVILQADIRIYLFIFLALFILTIILHALPVADWIKKISLYLPLAYGVILSLMIFISNNKSHK